MGCNSSKIREEPNVSSDKILRHPIGTDSNDYGQGTHLKRGYGDNLENKEINRKKALTVLNAVAEKVLAKQANDHPEKAIFIGTGESGKSTVFKQMRLCYGQGFNHYERQQFAKLVWADTLRAIRVLVDLCDEERRSPEGEPDLKILVESWLGRLGQSNKLNKEVAIIQSLDLSRRAFIEAEMDRDSKLFLQHRVPTGNMLLSVINGTKSKNSNILGQAMAGFAIYGELQEDTMRSRVDPPVGVVLDRETIADAAYALWKACPPQIKRMVVANQLGLETNASFFLHRIPEMKSPDFLATNDDILHARIKTTGITEAEFRVKKSRLVVMDVGGQRIERSKWIHNFDDVTCVLFVASVSEYDQALEEDNTVNRLDEALEVFQQTVNSRWFKAKSVQLFLNKVDILQDKCHVASFKAHFPGYTGMDNNPDDIIRYIENLFRQRFVAGNRNLYVHKTCATDTNMMKFVIGAVSDMILFENMKWVGMI